jgi:uncharacterized protein (TIGR02145 family)
MKTVRIFFGLITLSIFSFFFTYVAISVLAQGDSKIVIFQQDVSYSGVLEILEAPSGIIFTPIHKGDILSFGILGETGDTIRIRNHRYQEGTFFSCGSTLTDVRDGNQYATVEIGNQCWMAENLAYLPSVHNTSSETNPRYYVYGYSGTNVAAAKSELNYGTYGVLYNYLAAQNACPTGWRLPSDSEWQALEMGLGMSSAQAGMNGYRGTGNVGSKLAGSALLWQEDYMVNHSDFGLSNFNALPGGLFNDGSSNFENLGYSATFRSSTLDFGSDTLARRIEHHTSAVLRYSEMPAVGASVRCLKIPIMEGALNEWTLSLAANEPEWSDGLNSFKYDGTIEEGRLEVNDLSDKVDLVTGIVGCTGVGVQGASGGVFSPAMSSVDLVIAGESAEPLCMWDIAGIDLTQNIPLHQEVGIYQIAMVLTVI